MELLLVYDKLLYQEERLIRVQEGMKRHLDIMMHMLIVKEEGATRTIHTEAADTMAKMQTGTAPEGATQMETIALGVHLENEGNDLSVAVVVEIASREGAPKVQSGELLLCSVQANSRVKSAIQATKLQLCAPVIVHLPNKLRGGPRPVR
jgi:hypothetical protein